MKKSETKDRLPDIEPWINSGHRRAVPPIKAFAVYEDVPEPAEQENEQPGWYKAVAIIGLSVAAALFGAYLCNGYIVPPQPVKYQRPEVHEVEPGDTLWSVAAQHSDNSQDIRYVYYKIMRDNNADAGNLQPGQKLVIYR